MLSHARVHDLHLTVLTGPVLAETDPRYRGIQIPLAFWKVAAWVSDGALAATGYLLDQSAELVGVELEIALRRAAATHAVPPLGAFRTFQVPIADIEVLTALNLGLLSAADRLAVRERATTPSSRWVTLESESDFVL